MKNFIQWHLRWTLGPIVKDLEYFRDLSFYRLTRRKINDKPSIKHYREGLSPNHERPVCLFCSYDKESIVRENVYYYLNELRLAGFDIVLISTSEVIRDADIERLSRCCIKIMNRENRGYDFYGWKIALEKYPQYQLHTGLLLANDSVLGPLFDISNGVKQSFGGQGRNRTTDTRIFSIQVRLSDGFYVVPNSLNFHYFTVRCTRISSI
jgi:Rhamnan synthesis protein F